MDQKEKQLAGFSVSAPFRLCLCVVVKCVCVCLTVCCVCGLLLLCVVYGVCTVCMCGVWVCVAERGVVEEGVCGVVGGGWWFVGHCLLSMLWCSVHGGVVLCLWVCALCVCGACVVCGRAWACERCVGVWSGWRVCVCMVAWW